MALPTIMAVFIFSKLMSFVLAIWPIKPPANVSPAPVGSNTSSNGNAGATKTLSRGYYYVDNKRYKCYSVGVIPIGSTFKIKYNPRDPEEWRFVEE